MKDDEQIKEGDIVRVDFNNAQMTLSSEAIILNTPYAPGVSWVFKDIKTGRIYYVSEGCTITKRGTP